MRCGQAGRYCRRSGDNAGMLRGKFVWRRPAVHGLPVWLACLLILFSVVPVRAQAPLLHGAAHAQHGGGAADAVLPGLLPPVPLALDRANDLGEACIFPGGEVPPQAEAAWLHVRLPHRWAQTHPGYKGAMWYRFRVTLPERPPPYWAVYLPRAVMNAQVWVNGVPMAYTGSMIEPVTRNWYVPLLVQVPRNVWQVGDNLIQIKVVDGYPGRDGLAPIQVGPLSDLESAYRARYLAQVDGPMFANIALLALGVFMVIVWWRDRDLGAIGYQGLSAILWSLGTTANLAPQPWFDQGVWVRLAFVAMIWSTLLMGLFFQSFSGQRVRWAARVFWGLMIATPIWASLGLSMARMEWAYGLAYAVFMFSLVHALAMAIHTRRRDRMWLLGGCALLVPAAAHDLACQMNLLSFDAVYVLPYVCPIMVGCIFYMQAGDYGRSRRALNRLNDNLAETLSQREATLRESFARLAELERAQAVSAERSRILQDMHDGVGAHLTSALRQLQSPRAEGVDLPLVTQTLRDSLDQLKLSIDALSLPPGDVVGLLASLRFRIAPRLKAAGIELVWDVADLPPWPPGQPPALRQLQYILFEGLSNVLQHAGATRLVLSARQQGDALLLSLIDNGGGPQGEGGGQGLQTMRARAGAIGAQLSLLRVASGGTELRITLPLLAALPLDDLSSAT